MRILITGSNGLLGQKLVGKLGEESGIDLIVTSKGEARFNIPHLSRYFSLDVTNQYSVSEMIINHKPKVVINTAAFTNVDLCEENKEACDDLNVNAVKYLADSCAKVGAHLIHISTDFIFDGKNGPYIEEDVPNPISYYGLSKLKSEKLLYTHDVKSTILRTIVLFGVGKSLSKSNIVLWVKSALDQGKSIDIIDDQFRAPTLAEDLADACILAAKKKAYGIFNISGKDIMSIYEMVSRIANYYGKSMQNINKISTKDLKQKARRPAKTGFILDKARDILGYNPCSFEESLDIIDKQLNN